MGDAQTVSGWHNAAAVAGTSVRALRRMHSEGQVNGWKEGGKWTFYVDDLARIRSERQGFAQQPVTEALRARRQAPEETQETDMSEAADPKPETPETEMPEKPETDQAERPEETAPEPSPPAQSPAPAPAKRTRGKRGGQAGASRRPSAKLQRILGMSEKVRIYKCRDIADRQGQFIRDYSADLIADEKIDVEVFIQRYLVPDWGPGRYKVCAINLNGDEVGHEFRDILDPNRPNAAPGALGGFGPQGQSVAAQDQILGFAKEVDQRAREERERAERNAEQAQQLLLQHLTKQSEGKGDMMPLVMMLMMQQQRPGSELGDLKSKIEGLAEKVAQPPPMPALPPPPKDDSGEKTLELVKTLIETQKQSSWSLKDIAALLGPLTPLIEKLLNRQDPAMEFLKHQIGQLEKKLEEASQGGGDSVEDAIRTYERISSLTKGAQRGEDAANFWQFARDFFSNFDQNINALGSLAERISQERAPASRQLPARRQQRQIPEGFKVQIAKLDVTEDPGEKLDVLIASLRELYADPNFRGEATRMLTAARSGSRKETLKLLGTLLEESAKHHYITQEAAESALAAVRDHYGHVFAYLNGGKEWPGEEGEESDADAPAEPPEPGRAEAPAPGRPQPTRRVEPLPEGQAGEPDPESIPMGDESAA